jgi:Cu+-exporting ATPase
MGLATPTSIMVGTGRAAESGILFRQGDALQQLETAKVVAFDKTGTLTEGRPTLTDLLLYADTTRADVLRLLGSAEIASEHPVAKALVSTALDEGQKIADPDSIETLPGEGIAARVEGRSLLAGTARLMKRHGVSETNAESDIKTLSSQGKTPILIALDGELVAMAAVADRVRESAARTVATLRAAGLHTVLISGDTPTTAEAVGRSLGIDEVFGGVLPDGKKSIVEDLQHRHGPTVFVGDGINDAPALARADIGIALGSGTDVAIESADVVIMAGDPEGVVRARTISAATLRNIRQNLGWAFGYNVLLIPVAAGVLYPAFGVLLSPMLAAGAMALSSVFVVTNALRLRLAV